VLLSAFVTEKINIAFIFGGFIMGMVMPRHARLTEEVTRRIEDFVVALLLPLFFVYTGLKMNVGLLDRPALWLITAGLVAIAIVGKLAGASLAARLRATERSSADAAADVESRRASIVPTRAVRAYNPRRDAHGRLRLRQVNTRPRCRLRGPEEAAGRVAGPRRRVPRACGRAEHRRRDPR